MSAVSQLERPSADSITVQPLQPTIGAEISGIDLRYPLSTEVRDEIKATLLKYKVVFFRDQFINRQQQVAFARSFGEIYTPPYSAVEPIEDAPGLHLIAARSAKLKRNGEPKEEKNVAAEPERLRNAGGFGTAYHSDTSWRLVPSWGAVLRAVNLPPAGGDTIWVDAGLAYQGLSAEVKARLEGLFSAADFRDAILATGNDYPIVAHPIVRTHRETGEKILWVDFSKKPHILGLDLAEGRELLKIIHDQYARPEYQVRFEWRPGSIAFWDNRAAVHTGVRNYGDFPRVLERVLIADERLWADL